MSSSSTLPPAASVFRLWFAASILAACDTALDFAASPGINWTFTVASAATAFVAFRRASGQSLRFAPLLPFLLAAVLGAGAAMTTSGFMLFLVFVGVFMALAYGMLIATEPDDPALGQPHGMLTAPLFASGAVLAECARRSTEVASVGLRSEASIAALRGCAIALPLLIVFGLLLSGAEPVMGVWRDALERMIEDFSWLPRAACWAAFGVVLLGAFGKALRPARSREPALRRRNAGLLALGATERSIIFGSVAMLFGLFLVLQVPRLFGNVAGMSGSGVTYAKAVHEGFAELTIVATLCGLLIVAITPPDGTLRRSDRIWMSLVLAETLLLLVSAMRRLWLYEDAYGFTTLRLYVQVFDVLAFVALMLLAWQLRATPNFRTAAHQLGVAGLLTIAGLCFWNHQAWIVRANVARYASTGSIDVGYLARLPDAVPDLLQASTSLPQALREKVRACIALWQGVATSQDSTYNFRPRMEVPVWYEWNLRASDRLAALRAADLPRVIDNNVLAGVCYSPEAW